jgi:hypothetical protein
MPTIIPHAMTAVSKNPDYNTPNDAFLNWGRAFQAPAWKRCEFQHVLLTKVFRQKDQEFVGTLDDIRMGRNPQAAIQKLVQACSRHLPPSVSAAMLSCFVMISMLEALPL